jgi:MYXO-CTERM domain-containing protein
VTFSVTFSPAADGVASGTITFTSDAPATPSIPVDGTGGSPQLVPEPMSVDFGEVAVGTISAPVGVTIRNPGPAALSISAVTVGAPFTRASMALPITIEAGGSRVLDVMFAPTAAGAASGTITISSDAGANVVVPLAGTGLVPDDVEPSGCCSAGYDGSSSVIFAAFVLFGAIRRRRRIA